MIYLLGTDEAGYGPNLGPLVVGASLWRVANSDQLDFNIDLYELLSSGVTDRATDRSQRLAIADSKQLYASKDSLALLEQGVFAALGTLNRSVSNHAELFQSLGCPWRNSLPWQMGKERCLPMDISSEHCQKSSLALQTSCANGKVELLDLRSVVLHADEFNARCRQLGNKASVLSVATLGLVRELISRYRDFPLRIVCDKHGGRNSYAGLVMEEIAQHDVRNASPLLQTVCEGRAASAYRWHSGGSAREIWFMAKGERFLPTALASMVAKYLRELSMQAWNEFWRTHLPDIAPTAGYPVDAWRFREVIEPLTKLWEWDPELWWRNR